VLGSRTVTIALHAPIIRAFAEIVFTCVMMDIFNGHATPAPPKSLDENDVLKLGKIGCFVEFDVVRESNGSNGGLVKVMDQFGRHVEPKDIEP
jgi:hypothetical protein